MGGVCVSWLVTRHQPEVERDEDGRQPRPRNGAQPGADPDEHRRAGAEASAISVASRTVPVMSDVADTPAKTWTSEPGAASAQMARAATRPNGIEGHDPVVARHRVPHPRRVRAVDPAGEQDADRGGHGDHVAALQALVPVERQAVEQVLERRVRAEGEEEPEEPDDVPREPVARGKPARPARVHAA